MKQRQYSFGWRPDVPDCRDISFRTVFKVARGLPRSVDLRNKCSPVEDQGDLGSCTAQALIGALEFLELNCSTVIPRPIFADLSRLFVYYNERIDEGTVNWDSGAMIRTGIKILKKMGVCRESLWPYEIAKFKQSPDPACYKEGLDHQITGYQRLSTLAEMKACLAMGLPFVSGFSVYDSAMSDEVTRSGDVPMPGNRDILQGGHAIMAVGYDDLSSRFIFRNSWGEAWGQMGYGTLPYAFIADGLADDFWCIQTVESNQYACYKIKQDEAIV